MGHQEGGVGTEGKAIARTCVILCPRSEGQALPEYVGRCIWKGKVLSYV